MMSDFVTYCLVMWLAIIQVIRMKHQEWNGSDRRNAYIPDRPVKGPFKLLEVLMLNPSVKIIYRLKRNVLWDTS
jgi:hypothetical protein